MVLGEVTLSSTHPKRLRVKKCIHLRCDVCSKEFERTVNVRKWLLSKRHRCSVACFRLDSLSGGEAYRQRRATCLERYGVASVVVKPEVLAQNTLRANTPEARAKRFDTLQSYESQCEACDKTYRLTSAHQRWCRNCVPNEEATHPLKNYGVTQTDIDTMISTQRGNCGICERPLSEVSSQATHIDHDHRTGYVRGVLCSGYNHLLSGLDNIEWFEKARNYLAKPGVAPRCECRTLKKIRAKQSP